MFNQRALMLLEMVASTPSVFAPALDPGPNTLEFAKRLGLRIDGQALDFERYSHLSDIYEDPADEITLMCAAQTGKSAWLMNNLVRLCFKYPRGKIGYLFPDYPLATKFSRDRFAPMVRENPTLRDLDAGSANDLLATGIEADNVLTRSIAGSVIYFLATGSKTATEGVPLDALILDEVRKMGEGDVQRAEERTSSKDYATILRVSTAGIPDCTIHASFLKGDQRFFHTNCRCADGVVVSTAFPDCIADLRNASPKVLAGVEHAFRHQPNGVWSVYNQEYADGKRWPLAAYRCPRCQSWLTTPQDGWWQRHGAASVVHSYQLPQLLAPQWPAGRILSAFEDPRSDTTEFYNSKLGLPFLDTNAQPITDEVLAKAVDPSLRWFMNESPEWRQRHCDRVAMGIDTQDGYNVCWLKRVGQDGAWETVHVEVTLGDNPFRRCSELMLLYRVQVCVIDGAPHYNEARAFALRHPGRVWVANYVEDAHGRSPLRVWHDRRKSPAGEKDTERFKWSVTIARTKGLQWSLGKWKAGINRVPSPRTLIQMLPRRGDDVILSSRLAGATKVPTDICAKVVFPHLKAVAFIKAYQNEDAERRGILTLRAEHVKLDPHFAHAGLYCDIALLRVMQPSALGDDEEADDVAGDL